MILPDEDGSKHITANQLKLIAPYITAYNLQRFVEPLNIAMMEFGINTRLRKAAFLAQVCHESSSFQFMEELAGGGAYDNRRDLGNLEPIAIETANQNGTTAGRFYKGHGPIQITGYKNHKLCGEALGLDLINHPTLLIRPENGCRSAAWFWRVGAGLNLGSLAKSLGIPYGCNLNDFADRGDFENITVAIVGGLASLPQRVVYHDRALKVLA